MDFPSPPRAVSRRHGVSMDAPPVNASRRCPSIPRSGHHGTPYGASSRVLSVPPATLGRMNIVLPLLALVIGVLVGAVAALAWSRRAGDPDVLRALSARGDDQAVLKDGLERLHERLMDVEQQRASWQG